VHVGALSTALASIHDGRTAAVPPSRARVLLGTTGIAREQRAARAVKVAGKEPQRAPPGFYRALLDEHKAYYAPVDEFLSATDRFTCFA